MSLKNFITFFVPACALATASASAALVSFEGEVDLFGPTFDRPFVDGFDLGPSNRDVGYDARPFYVTDDGIYVIRTETVDVDNVVFWDGTLLLYADAFDPLLSEQNLIAYVGVDFDFFGESLVSLPLEAGRQYVLVQAGVSSFEFGPYTGTAESLTRGPASLVFGLASDVPEPTVAMLIPAALLLRRRRMTA